MYNFDYIYNNIFNKVIFIYIIIKNIKIKIFYIFQYIINNFSNYLKYLYKSNY